MVTRASALLALCLTVTAQDKRLWERPIGAGFAGPAVAANQVLVFHRNGSEEVLEALDPRTGRPLWRAANPTQYRDDFGFDEGPRSAPSVSQGRVFTYGAEGVLSATDLSTGKRLWSVDVMKKYGVEKGFFGAAGTPLAAGQNVIVNAGSRSGAGVVAFDAATGRESWRATNDGPSYSSGVLATLEGTQAAVFLTQDGLAALDAASGAVINQTRWRSRSRASVNAASPVVAGNEIFLSASYGTGAILLRGFKPVWQGDESLSNHYATSVQIGGYLYGFHGRQEYGQEFRCVEWKSGKVMWSQEGFGAGTVQLEAGRLFIQREDGELVIADPSPQSFKVLSRRKLLPGPIRAYAAISPNLYCLRNTTTLACFAR